MLYLCSTDIIPVNGGVTNATTLASMLCRSLMSPDMYFSTLAGSAPPGVFRRGAHPAAK